MTGRIPQAFLNDLLDRIDLPSLIDEHVPLKKRGQVYVACCPFHNEKNPSFNVIPQKGFYHCFGCGVSGNAISFLVDYLKQDFLDAVDTLAEKAGLTVPRERGNKESLKKNLSLYEILNKVAAYYQTMLEATPEALSYLDARGISPDTIKRFQIGLAPDGWRHLLQAFPNHQDALIETGMLIQNEKGNRYDRYRHRIMFPIHDKKGRIVGFGGRVIKKEDNPKYLNSPETPLFHKSRELYGLYQALQVQTKSLIIVEGYMDVVALAEHQINYAVATLGTATSASHLPLLLRQHQTLYFCFDGDNAGKQAAWRALLTSLPFLEDTLTIKFAFLPEGNDPDSFVKQHGKEAFLALLNKALPISDFFIAKLREELDLSTPSGRSGLISLAKDPLKTLSKGVYKEIILERLAELSRIDKGRIEALLLTDESPETVLNQQQRGKSSPMRTACAILVQYPHLLSKLAKPENPSMLNQEGSDVLIALLNTITESTTTAQLIECWRGHKNANIINKLAVMPLAIPLDGMLYELEGALTQIKRGVQQAEIENILKKAAITPLDENERIELQKKIKQLKAQGRQAKSHEET